MFLTTAGAVLGVSALALVTSGVVSIDDFVAKTPSSGVARPDGSPSIHVLLLDGYPREDSLAEMGIDLTPFTSALNDLGFTLNNDARSTYSNTSLSLASSMLLDPDEISRYANTSSSNQLWASWQVLRRRYLVDVPFMDDLRKAGYELRYGASEIGLSEWRGWDVTFDSGNLTDTEALLIQRSPLAPLLAEWVMDQRRARVDATLEWWASQAGSGQAVSLAHITPPHPPLLWANGGTETMPLPCWYERGCELATINFMRLGFNEKSFADAIRGQLDGLNGRVISAVQRIARADPTAVIVVLSDHGLRHESPETDEWHRTFLASRNAPPLSGPDALFPSLLEGTRQ